MGAIEDVYKYLTTGTATVNSSRCFVNLMPNDPDAAVALIETPGLPSERVFNRNLPLFERLRVQVLVRGTTNGSQAARTLAENVWIQLVKVANQQLTGASTGFTYLAIEDVQPPAYIGRDDRNRPLYSANYDVMPAR